MGQEAHIPKFIFLLPRPPALPPPTAAEPVHVHVGGEPEREHSPLCCKRSRLEYFELGVYSTGHPLFTRTATITYSIS